MQNMMGNEEWAKGEQHVRGVQGEQDENYEVEVQGDLREVRENLCFVVTLDEGRDEPRILGCNGSV